MSEPLADFVAHMERSLKKIDLDVDQLIELEVRLVNTWRKQLENAINRTTIDWPTFNRMISSMEEFEIVIMESVKK